MHVISLSSPVSKKGLEELRSRHLPVGNRWVATKNSGSLDILTDPDVGILCERADANDFARGITEGLVRSWDREKITAFAEKYRGENVAQIIHSVYREVLSKNISGNG